MHSWFCVKLISKLGSSITSQQLEVFLEEISNKQMHVHTCNHNVTVKQFDLLSVGRLLHQEPPRGLLVA